MKPAPELATFAFHEVTDDPRASGFQRPAALPYKHTRLAFAQHIQHGAVIPERSVAVAAEALPHRVAVFAEVGENRSHIV